MLHTASGFGRYQCLKVLINAGLDVNSTTENGYTPLMYAAMDYASFVYFDGFRKSSEMCVEVLLHKGANINIINKENRKCNTNAHVSPIFIQQQLQQSDPSGAVCCWRNGILQGLRFARAFV